MRLRNTVIVLVLLAIVGGYALVILLGSRPVPTPTLLNVKTKDITHIDLRYPKHEIDLVRNPNHTWKILKPISAEADQGEINALLETIAGAKINKTIAEKPSDMAPFGLAKPSVVLTIETDKKKQPPVLDIGAVAPMGLGTYVKLANGPAILMTNSGFMGAMMKRVNDLRSRDLVSFSMADARKIMVQRESGKPLELDKRSGKWRIVSPDHCLADSDAVAQLLTRIVNARIMDFVSDAPKDLGKYGLKEPRLEVTVFTGKGGARHSLLFGAKESSDKDVFVKRGSQPYVFKVEDKLFRKLDVGLLDLRDKTVMGFDPKQVSRVEVVNHGKKYELERAAGGGWQVIADGKRSPADNDAVHTMVKELAQLKGDKIIADPMKDPHKYGLDKPTEEITVFGKDGKKIGAVNLARIHRKVEASPTPTPGPGQAESGEKIKTAETAFEDYAYSTAGTPVYSLIPSDLSQFDMTAEQFISQPAATPTPAKKKINNKS